MVAGNWVPELVELGGGVYDLVPTGAHSPAITWDELVADGKTYQISDQKAAFEHIGHEVVITGTLDKDTIKVDKIEAATKDKA